MVEITQMWLVNLAHLIVNNCLMVVVNPPCSISRPPIIKSLLRSFCRKLRCCLLILKTQGRSRRYQHSQEVHKVAPKWKRIEGIKAVIARIIEATKSTLKRAVLVATMTTKLYQMKRSPSAKKVTKMYHHFCMAVDSVRITKLGTMVQ